MGAWGTDILQGDVTADVYADFMERFDKGMKPAAIRAELEADYSDALDDFDDAPLFWLALAKAQWDCGQLQSDVFAKVSEIITTGQDLERWQEAGEEAVRKRSEVLTRFLGYLGEPNP